MVRPEGLEPPTYRFEVCHSIQLSYGRKFSFISLKNYTTSGLGKQHGENIAMSLMVLTILSLGTEDLMNNDMTVYFWGISLHFHHFDKHHGVRL